MAGGTALLVLDMQAEFFSPEGFLSTKHLHIGELERCLANLLRSFRQSNNSSDNSNSNSNSNRTVFWISSEYGPEKLEPKTLDRPHGAAYAAAPLNDGQLAGSLAGLAQPCCVPGSSAAELHPFIATMVAPAADHRLTKHYLSAFTDTDLAETLRSLSVSNVVICGLLSHSSVHATAADAFFLGFNVHVIGDMLGFTNRHKHAESLAAIAQWYGAVVTLADLIGTSAASVYGCGDTHLIQDILPPDLAATAFDILKNSEVAWQQMHHHGGPVPRLVCIQGSVDADGSIPIYRHPADEHPTFHPFTPTVDRIRQLLSARLGQDFNHVLIQLYRDGKDFISEHSDKTLDVCHGSVIVNLSLGAAREMVLRSKRDVTASPTATPSTTDSAATTVSPFIANLLSQRKSQRLKLDHNSLFVLGPKTNAIYLHSIAQDKQNQSLSPSPETGLERISLTFRSIATFITQDPLHGPRIYGQGATQKSKHLANLISKDPVHMQDMLHAFGSENQQSYDFDWNTVYGGGFDVIDCNP
eukprot:jgi/Hompol1/6273/HPOL_004943-RA